GTIGGADHLTTVHRNPEIKHALPDLAAFGIHVFKALHQGNCGFASGDGVAGIGNWGAENNPKAFTVALIKVTATLDEEVRSVFQERIVKRNIIIDRQRLGEFGVIED